MAQQSADLCDSVVAPESKPLTCCMLASFFVACHFACFLGELFAGCRVCTITGLLRFRVVGSCPLTSAVFRQQPQWQGACCRFGCCCAFVLQRSALDECVHAKHTGCQPVCGCMPQVLSAVHACVALSGCMYYCSLRADVLRVSRRGRPHVSSRLVQLLAVAGLWVQKLVSFCSMMSTLLFGPPVQALACVEAI